MIPKFIWNCLIKGQEQTKKTEELFNGNVVIFGLFGAESVTCSMGYLPGYVKLYDDFKAAGIDKVICVSTDPLNLLRALAENAGVDGKEIIMLSDPDGGIASSFGLHIDAPSHGLGSGCTRFAALVKDGKMVFLKVDEKGKIASSRADEMLKEIRRANRE